MSAKRVPTPAQALRHVLGCMPSSARAAVALDVGAHAGAFAREMLDTGLFEEVVAFEPNPACAPALEAMAVLDSRLRVVASAVAQAEGERDLHCDANLATGSLLPYAAGYRTDGAVSRVRVPVLTLDRYRERHLAGRRVGLLKVDTQGQDLAVLEGARELLAADRPCVCVELIYVPMYEGQARPEQILALLRGLGYTLYSLYNLHATVEGRLAFADALLVPEEVSIPASQDYVQLDDRESLETQIRILEGVCRERLSVIDVLDAEVKRLTR